MTETKKLTRRSVSRDKNRTNNNGKTSDVTSKSSPISKTDEKAQVSSNEKRGNT